MGVAFFFVISGFLLYRPFLAARFAGRRPPPRIRDYARRRVLRIVPAYWVALTVLAATVGLCGVFTGDWWVYYFFLQNLRLATTLCGIGTAWSLAIEASFYVALPLWALLMARIQRGRPARTMVRIEAAALLAVSLASIVARTWSFAATGRQTAIDVTLVGNADWFAYGMGLALASVGAAGPRARVAGRARHQRPRVAAVGAGGIPLVAGRDPARDVADAAADLQRRPLAGRAPDLPRVGFLLALPAAFGDERRGLPRRILGNRFLAWFGLVSYGVFLWHQPLMPTSHRRTAV